jgi:hypothetical protein
MCEIIEKLVRLLTPAIRAIFSSPLSNVFATRTQSAYDRMVLKRWMIAESTENLTQAHRLLQVQAASPSRYKLFAILQHSILKSCLLFFSIFHLKKTSVAQPILEKCVPGTIKERQ